VAKEGKSGLTEVCMKAGGLTAKLMEEEDLFMLMAMCMTDSGWTTKHMAMESIDISMGPSTKVSGKKTNSTVKGLRLGQMVRSMKELISKGRSTASAASLGLMALHTMACLLIITFKVKENTTGLTAESTKEVGSTTRWKVMVSSRGQTVGNTKESTLMIRRKVKESSTGLTEENTKEAGRMENRMELEFTPLLVENQRKASGTKASVFAGSEDYK